MDRTMSFFASTMSEVLVLYVSTRLSAESVPGGQSTQSSKVS